MFVTWDFWAHFSPFLYLHLCPHVHIPLSSFSPLPTYPSLLPLVFSSTVFPSPVSSSPLPTFSRLTLSFLSTFALTNVSSCHHPPLYFQRFYPPIPFFFSFSLLFFLLLLHFPLSVSFFISPLPVLTSSSLVFFFLFTHFFKLFCVLKCSVHSLSQLSLISVWGNSLVLAPGGERGMPGLYTHSHTNTHIVPKYLTWMVTGLNWAEGETSVAVRSTVLCITFQLLISDLFLLFTHSPFWSMVWFKNPRNQKTVWADLDISILLTLSTQFSFCKINCIMQSLMGA